MSEENLKQLKEDSTKTDGNTLMRYIRVLSELSNQLRYASQKRVMVEVALIKLTRPSMEPDMDSVLQRLKQLEAAVEDLEAGGFMPKAGMPPQVGMLPASADSRECSPKWQLSRCRQQACRVFHQEMLLKQQEQALSRQTRLVFHRPS